MEGEPGELRERGDQIELGTASSEAGIGVHRADTAATIERGKNRPAGHALINKDSMQSDGSPSGIPSSWRIASPRVTIKH